MSIPKTLVAAFERGLERDKLHTAVLFHDGKQITSLRYEEVNSMAHQVKEALLKFTCQQHIILVIGRTQFTIPAFIGIMAADSIFFYQPPEVTRLQLDHLIQELRICFIMDDQFDIKHSIKIPQTTLTLHHLDDMAAKHVADISPPLAYIVTTSGSTGKPKIVKVPHCCIMPNILHLSELYDLQPNDMVLQSAPLTFDPSVVEIFTTLLTGATLLCVPDNVRMQPSLLAHIILTLKVNIIQATPSLMLAFTHKDRRDIMCQLRLLSLGGETCPNRKTLKSWAQSESLPSVFNLYGITEVSSWATYYEIKSSDDDVSEVPIGVPLQATQVEIKKKGSLHEIFLGGKDRVCLVGDELTIPQTGVMRPTGDSVELRDGKMYCTGRIDNKIKRMGKMVDLDAISSVISSLHGVKQSIAIWKPPTSLTLCILVDSEAYESKEIIQAAKSLICDKLPPHCLPDGFRICTNFPLTPHGKVDQRALWEEISKSQSEDIDVPSYLSSLWKEHVGRLPSKDDNFILSGGNSLTALSIVNSLCEKCGKKLPNLLDILLNSAYSKVVQYLISEHSNSSVIFNNSVTNSTSEQSSARDLNISRVFSHATQGTVMLECGDCEENDSMEIVWRYNTRKCVDASPIIAITELMSHAQKCGKASSGDGLVLIGSHSGLFSCLCLDSGDVLWSVFLPDRIEKSACVTQCGKYCSVGAYNGVVYFITLSSGVIEWEFQTGNAIKCTPVTHPDLNWIFVGSHDHHLYVLDPKAEICVWKKNLGSSVSASVCFSDNNHNLLVAALNGICYKLRAVDGAEMWRFACEKPVFSTPCCHAELSYVADVGGHLYQIGANGKELWTYKTGGPIFSSPAMIQISSNSNHRVLFGCHDNHIHCISSEGEKLWTFEASSVLYASAYIADRIYIASSNGFLYTLSLDGKETCRLKLDGDVFSSPVCADIRGQQVLVIGCRNDYVYGIKIGG